jgi:hypothetical protein
VDEVAKHHVTLVMQNIDEVPDRLDVIRLRLEEEERLEWDVLVMPEMHVPALKVSVQDTRESFRESGPVINVRVNIKLRALGNANGGTRISEHLVGSDTEKDKRICLVEISGVLSDNRLVVDALGVNVDGARITNNGVVHFDRIRERENYFEDNFHKNFNFGISLVKTKKPQLFFFTRKLGHFLF